MSILALIVLAVILCVLFGGGSWYANGGAYRNFSGPSILTIVVVLILLRYFHII